MTASETQLRNMLFDVLDYIDPIMDQLVYLDRMHVERIKEMSGWEKQITTRAADYRGEPPAIDRTAQFR
jgi:hypothetical protein